MFSGPVAAFLASESQMFQCDNITRRQTWAVSFQVDQKNQAFDNENVVVTWRKEHNL